jgi:hypothetical protein
MRRGGWGGGLGANERLAERPVRPGPEVPVVLGGGKKLFADGSAPHSFKLTRSRVSPNALIVGHYEREGEIRIGDATLDSASESEVARQERMKRES